MLSASQGVQRRCAGLNESGCIAPWWLRPEQGRRRCDLTLREAHRFVAHTVQCIEHGHVRRQRLLGDQVPRQHHPVVVRQAVRPQPQLPHLDGPIAQSRAQASLINERPGSTNGVAMGNTDTSCGTIESSDFARHFPCQLGSDVPSAGRRWSQLMTVFGFDGAGTSLPGGESGKKPAL